MHDYEEAYARIQLGLDRILMAQKKNKTLLTAFSIAGGCMLITVVLLFAAWQKAVNTPKIEYVEVEKEVVSYKVIDPSESEAFHDLAETQQDTFLMYDHTYGDIWVPVLASVPASEYDPELYVKDESGVITYNSPEIKSWKGIDVSIYQGDIDWTRVKLDGVDFAMIRLGYRGYETGKIVLDAKFEQNVKGALNAGIDVGVYFYSQALTVDEALEEAEFVIDNLSGMNITYPVVFDWEVVGEETARTNETSPQTLTDCAIVFCERIKEAGYIPKVYSNKKTAVWKYDLSRLQDYDFWLAEYSDKPSYYYNYTMWQYTYEGKISGIEGGVDMNISFVNYADRE